jgi:phage terminase large subunit
MGAIKATVNFQHIDTAKREGKDGVILQGSAGSSKTISALQWLGQFAASNRGQRISAYRQFRSSVKETLVADFRCVMGEGWIDEETGRPNNGMQIWDDKCWNASELLYKFPNGSLIRFNGCDKAANRKGKRDDISYINEVTEVNYDSYNQIAMRTSFVICDFNPSFSHFIYEFKANPDFAYHVSTFRDNPMLPPGERKTILSYEPTKFNKERGTADAALWSIYGLGQPAMMKGLIFTNWEETTDWPSIDACERRGYGCDIGFIDPTTLIECKFAQNTLYLRQKVYATGITDLPNPETGEESLVELMDQGQVAKDQPIYVDCAAPQSIKAMRSQGYNALPSKKGAGSVMEGIGIMKRFKIKIHSDSRQLVEAFSKYCWKVNQQGMITSTPDHEFSHCIDAVRYFCITQLGSVMLGNPRQKRTTRARGAIKRF